MKKEILFRVNAGGEFGSGHLNRCLVLARRLREEFDPYFLVKGDNKIGELLYKENFNFKLAMHGFDEQIKDIKALRPNLVFLDMKETPASFVREIKEFAPVIDLDDGGTGALAANITVNSLPVHGSRQANLDSLKYLIFDPEITKFKNKSVSGKVKKVLVSFGGVDPAGLSGVMIRIGKLAALDLDWTIVRGRFNRENWQPGDYTEITREGHIFDLVAEADLVVTSFGMTAFEAAAVGTPVLLLNPGEYHEDLSSLTPYFRSIGVFAKGADGDNTPELCRAFTEALEDNDGFVSRAVAAGKAVDKKGVERMEALVRHMLDFGSRDACHVCGARNETALVRDEEKTIFECGTCRLLYTRFNDTKVFSYGDSYFEEEYEAQYGRTYLEDRINIDELNRVRLETMNALFDKSFKNHTGEKRLFEAGAAYGFFLDLARESGWEVRGVEPSAAAVSYAGDKLHLPVAEGVFPDVELESEQFHALAMWYTLEHVPELGPVMEKIYISLKQGGVLAFSTPNWRGFSGRFHTEKYLEEHPADHFYDFSVPTMKRLLKRYRFKVKKVRVTGIHYDRVLGDRKGGFWDNGFFRGLYNFAAKLFRLGDTFEIYAVKK